MFVWTLPQQHDFRGVYGWGFDAIEIDLTWFASM
jgi:hypothetical protein